MDSSKTGIPKTPAGFGYGFGEDGELLQIERPGWLSDRTFEYNVRNINPSLYPRRYKKFGDLLTQHVYDLMLYFGLRKYYVPDNIPEADATFIFANRENFRDSKKLLVLINGNGALRAGQWARR